MARLHRRYAKKRRNPAPEGAPRHNPPLMADLVEWVGPGFGAFAATRFATHVATTQLAKHKPDLAKHAGAGVSVASFLAAWFLANRVKFLAKYHTQITVGAAIAAIQSLLQIYVPKLGWMVSDASPELPASSGLALNNQQAIAQNLNLQPTDEDPSEFTYNDSFDAGRYASPGKGQESPSSGVRKDDDAELADLEIDDAIGQNNMGVFQN